MIADFFRGTRQAGARRRGADAPRPGIRARQAGDADRRHRMRHRRADHHDRPEQGLYDNGRRPAAGTVGRIPHPDKKAGLENRVTAIQGSMDALPFSPGEFDVIWAEGSIYNIGFERGLREWRQYLKPGGIIAVTECSWLSGARLASKFISDYFPDIDSPSGKVRILEEAGYAPLAHFALPEHCWTENYFAHASARIQDSSSNTGTVKSTPAGRNAEKRDRPLRKIQSVLRLRLLHRPKPEE